MSELGTRPATRSLLLRVGLVVALLGIAVSLLLRSGSYETTAAVVESAAAQEVCLDASGTALCLNREHIEHLQLTGLGVGDCVAVTYRGGLVPDGLTRVRAGSCPA